MHDMECHSMLCNCFHSQIFSASSSPFACRSVNMSFSLFPSLPLRKEQSSSGSSVIVNSQENVYHINPLRDDLHDEPKSPFSFLLYRRKKETKQTNKKNTKSGKIRVMEFGCACLQTSKCQRFYTLLIIHKK